MSPHLIRWFKLVLVEILMPKYILLSDKWSNLCFFLNILLKPNYFKKLLFIIFTYVCKENSTCPNYPGVLSRLVPCI